MMYSRHFYFFLVFSCEENIIYFPTLHFKTQQQFKFNDTFTSLLLDEYIYLIYENSLCNKSYGL
jgi:hypothetical protein